MNSASLVMLAVASTTLDGWIAANAGEREKVICRKEVNGEYFFVARAHDDKLRLGSRVDLTGLREPYSWSVAWLLRNENGGSITRKVVPTEVRKDLVREKEKAYFESVEYQTINVGVSARLRVAVSIEKSGSARYEVEICETAL